MGRRKKMKSPEQKRAENRIRIASESGSTYSDLLQTYMSEGNKKLSLKRKMFDRVGYAHDLFKTAWRFPYGRYNKEKIEEIK